MIIITNFIQVHEEVANRDPELAKEFMDEIEKEIELKNGGNQKNKGLWDKVLDTLSSASSGS